MNCLNVATTAISNLSPADVLKAVIAMSGSAIGLLAGLGQISLSAKSRRTIEWINNTIDKDAGNEPRQKILKELRLSQEGRLIAAHYVPWWKFMLLPTWAIGYAVPTIQSAIRAVVDNKEPNDILLSIAFHSLGCLYLSWLTIGWYAERFRINDHYSRRLSTVPRISLWKMGSKPFLTAGFCAACPISLYISLFLIITGRNTLTESLAVVLLLIGFYSLWFTIPFARRYARRWSTITESGRTWHDESAKEVAMTLRSWMGGSSPITSTDNKDAYTRKQ